MTQVQGIAEDIAAETRGQRQCHTAELGGLNRIAAEVGAVKPPKRTRRRRAQKPKDAPNHQVNFVPRRDRVNAVYQTPAAPQVVALARDWNGLRGTDNAPAVGAPLQSGPDVGAFRVQHIKTGKPWADCVLNGVPADRDVRFPDPFTLQKSSIVVVSNTLSDTSASTSSTSSSTSYDWTTYGVFRGDPVKTLLQCGQPVLNSYKCDWKSADGVWYSGGMASADFITRPNGCTLDIIPRLVGPVHTAKLYAFPVVPIISTLLADADQTGWPTNPNTGLSPVQVSWGGREWEIDATSKGVRLVSLPIDSRCLDFQIGNLERNAYGSTGMMAWTTWVFWFSGLGASDRVDFVVNFTEESMPISIGKSTQYAYPGSIRSSNSRVRDDNSNTVRQAMEAGLNAYSWVDKAINIAKVAWGIGSKIVGAFAGSAVGSMAPLTVEMAAALTQSRKADPPRLTKEAHNAEEKVPDVHEDYDFPRRESLPLETPRQSLRLRPLDSRASSSTSQVPASAGPVR